MGGPSAVQYLSATTPFSGVLTTHLLSPVAPLSSAAGVANEFKIAAPGVFTKSYVFGRWLTRPLPAQTIGAMNWTLTGLWRRNNTTNQDVANTGFGGCLAQWREGTGVVARFFDSPTTGSTPTAALQAEDVIANVIAGGALTLVANDVLALEVWFTVQSNTTTARDWSFLYGGPTQLVTGNYTYNSTASFDATLTAATAITTA